MSKLKYTLTLTADDIFALSKVLYQQTKQNEEDAALFQNNSPGLYKIVSRDLDDCKRLQREVNKLTTQVTITAIHQESGAVLVMQGVTNVTESTNTWTVTIGGLTISFDRTAWAIITNSIAPTIASE